MVSTTTSRFLSAYYVGNVLVLASYLVLRSFADKVGEGRRAQLKSFVRLDSSE